MTLPEAMATLPAWVTIWANFLTVVALFLPVSLLIWKASRKAAIVTVIGTVLAMGSVMYLFHVMGFVRLIGLGHVIFWVPTVVFLIGQQARGDMSIWPRRIIWFIIGVISVSLAFDTIDVIRWILGERAPMV